MRISSEIGGQMSEDGGRKTEGGRRKTEDGGGMDGSDDFVGSINLGNH